MVKLSDFIGELVTDLSNARSHADYASAALSEFYHADPFVKNLPVPHFTVDEAEIEVPVMVVGVVTGSEQFNAQKASLLDIVKQKLPLLILQNYKWNYVREREIEKEKKEKERFSEDSLSAENSKPRSRRAEFEAFEFSQEQLDNFTESAKKVSDKMNEHLEKYLNQYNYELLKLLDLSESFSKELMRVILGDLRHYKKDQLPYFTDAAVNRAANFIGNLMFFEFKKIMRSDSGVNIEVATGKMNEYFSGFDKDCFLRIKLKIKEQDLNLVVEERDGKERRYLSLT